MNNQEKVRKYLADIEAAANFFNTHFIDKEMIYKTSNKSISVKFQTYHFSHLCGIKYQDGAKQFFKAVLEKKLDLSKISIKEDGTTLLKLPLLKSIDMLITKDVQITDNAVYLNLSFDSSIRTKKMIFALTLNIDNQNDFYPNSLINLNNINNFPRGEKVVGIKSINLLNYEEKIYF